MRVFLFALAFLGFSQGAMAQELSEDQVKELALQAILENPEIIMQAVALLEQREKERQAAGAAQVRLKLESDTNSPNLGNPDGDVTVVEFFDYNCPYCKRAGAALKATMETDENVRVIYREWPILGEGSVYAARAALAARNQEKYNEMHWALMFAPGRATEASVLKIARDLELDVDKLKADMTSIAVEAHLAESSEMARSLGFTGTPAFIIGDTSLPGVLSEAEFAQYIEQARGQN